MDGTVNLAGGWDTLWSAIQGIVSGPVTNILTVVGVILVIFAVSKYFFDKRRGSGVSQGLGIVFWTLLVGALLTAPQVIFPIALRLLDIVANLVIAIVNSASGS